MCVLYSNALNSALKLYLHQRVFDKYDCGRSLDYTQVVFKCVKSFLTIQKWLACVHVSNFNMQFYINLNILTLISLCTSL